MHHELTAGVDMWHLAALDGELRSIKVTDGPAGARGERWFGTSSACVPCGTALGATWSPKTAAEVAGVLARETRRKGADVLLAPTVNLHRHPLAGRNFECMSEDPELTAELTVAWIREIQSHGVAACVKHLVANDQETDRHSISVEVDEAVLRELYLRPFEAAVCEAGTWTIMSAYNRLGGEYCSSNRWLLTEVLRDEWGFDGVVISDWWGTHSTAAIEAGLDLEMPGPARHLGPKVADGLQAGHVSTEAVQRSNRAVFDLAERVGALQGTGDAASSETSVDDPEDRAVLRRAAARSIVMLRNERSVLPLDADASVALCGPNATRTAIMGGGSASFVAHPHSNVAEAMRARMTDVTHVAGDAAPGELPPLESQEPFTVEHYNSAEPDDDPVLVEQSLTSRLLWLGSPGPGVAEQGSSVRISGSLIAQRTGTHTFGLVTGATGELSIDRTVLIDNRDSRQPGTAFFGMGSAEERAEVELTAGQKVQVEAVTSPVDGMALGGLAIGHAEPADSDPLRAATDAAAGAQVTVVVVGGNDRWETEGSDRSGFELPDGQAELVRAVCEANPNTVVVINCGAPVDLSCAEGAAAVLLFWYPGLEGAEAVLDVLLGEADPGGRLPTTWGHRLGDWESNDNFPGDGTVVRYEEGWSVGYRGFDRAGIEPAYCFGHGLSHAHFEWSDAALDRDQLSGDDLLNGEVIRASVRVENTSDRRGIEVIQCYLAPVSGDAVDPRRAPQWLAGFRSIELDAGESARVSIPIGAAAFRRWDSGWTIPAGNWELRLSASSRDHRFTRPVITQS